MTHAEKAKALFTNGCNCSQAVFCAFAPELGIDEQTAMRLCCGLGGGVGRLREVCGAVTGAAMVISMLFSGSDGRNRTDVYRLVQQFADSFKAETGSVICRVMLGLDKESPLSPTPDERTQQYYRKRPCAQIVYLAAEELDKLIGKEKNG